MIILLRFITQYIVVEEYEQVSSASFFKHGKRINWFLSNRLRWVKSNKQLMGVVPAWSELGVHQSTPSLSQKHTPLFCCSWIDLAIHTQPYSPWPLFERYWKVLGRGLVHLAFWHESFKNSTLNREASLKETGMGTYNTLFLEKRKPFNSKSMSTAYWVSVLPNVIKEVGIRKKLKLFRLETKFSELVALTFLWP